MVKKGRKPRQPQKKRQPIQKFQATLEFVATSDSSGRLRRAVDLALRGGQRTDGLRNSPDHLSSDGDNDSRQGSPTVDKVSSKEVADPGLREDA